VPEWRTVIGVVRNAAQEDWIAPPRPELYLPYLQNRGYLENPASHMAYLTLVVRTRDGASPPASAVKAAVWTINRNVPVSQVQTMEEAIGDATGESRFYVLLLSAFGASALLLAAVGIYGVMSYAVSRRTHEIGLRMALGADRRQVLVEVIGQGLRVAAAGAAVGLVAALMLTELMATLLYGVDARDPVTFLAVAGVLITVAILASYLPARHATRIDPIVALRHD
jgi:putative ABC transport system permease protein